MPTRDDFSSRVRRLLASRAGNCCSICRVQTSGPSLADADSAVSIGVAAHITAAALGGPRFDSTLSQEQRQHADNGIWLCQGCARLVDVDLASYTVPALRSIKATHERTARSAIVRSDHLALMHSQDSSATGAELADPTYMPGRGVDVISAYREEPLLKFQGRPLPYSVAWLGQQDLKAIGVVVHRDDFRLPDELESRTTTFVEQYRRSNRAPLYESDMVRLLQVSSAEDGSLILHVSQTSYYRHVASNFACEVLLEPPDRTVRSTYLPGPKLPGLAASPMSNHIGLNCGVVTSDGKLVYGHKSSRVIHDARTDEISVSSSWKWPHHWAPEALWHAFLVEAADELAISSRECVGLTLRAVLRDLRKGGKPELFAAAQVKTTLAEVRRRHVLRESRGHWEFEFVDGIDVAELTAAALATVFARPLASTNLQAFCAVVAATGSHGHR